MIKRILIFIFVFTAILAANDDHSLKLPKLVILNPDSTFIKPRGSLEFSKSISFIHQSPKLRIRQMIFLPQKMKFSVFPEEKRQDKSLHDHNLMVFGGYRKWFGLNYQGLVNKENIYNEMIINGETLQPQDEGFQTSEVVFDNRFQYFIEKNRVLGLDFVYKTGKEALYVEKTKSGDPLYNPITQSNDKKEINGRLKYQWEDWRLGLDFDYLMFKGEKRNYPEIDDLDDIDLDWDDFHYSSYGFHVDKNILNKGDYLLDWSFIYKGFKLKTPVLDLVEGFWFMFDYGEEDDFHYFMNDFTFKYRHWDLYASIVIDENGEFDIYPRINYSDVIYNLSFYVDLSSRKEFLYEKELTFERGSLYHLMSNWGCLFDISRINQAELGVVPFENEKTSLSISAGFLDLELPDHRFFYNRYTSVKHYTGVMLLGDRLNDLKECRIKGKWFYRLGEKSKLIARLTYHYYFDEEKDRFGLSDESYPDWQGELLFDYQFSDDLSAVIHGDYRSSTGMTLEEFIPPYSSMAYPKPVQKSCKDYVNFDIEIRYNIENFGDVFFIVENLLNRKQYWLYPLIEPDVRLALGFEYRF